MQRLSLDTAGLWPSAGATLGATPAPEGARHATPGTAGTPGTGGATRPDAAPRAAPSSAPAARQAAALRPGALQAWTPGQQQNVAATQQTLVYLDQLGQTLGEFKQALGQTLALKTPATTSLVRQRDAVAQLWQQRSAATGGTLDAQGGLNPPGEARQRFQVRGLDMGALTSPERETLSLNLPGQRQPLTLVLGQQGQATEALHSLNSTLAPAGLSAALSDGGELQLSVPERQWPALRDGLSVRGGGKRFPAGQPTRPRLEASPDALQTEHWQLGDSAGQRDTLQAVLGAEQRLRTSRNQARSLLASWQADTEASPAAPLAWAQQTAQQTADRLAAAPSFASWRELLPAVSGLRRDRVNSLLG